MPAGSDTHSPLQRFEERLNRLERANTRLPAYSRDSRRAYGELPSGNDEAIPVTEKPLPKQELAGSQPAKELHDARRSEQGKAKPARHIFELSVEDEKRPRR